MYGNYGDTKYRNSNHEVLQPVSENKLNFLLLPNKHFIVLPSGSTTA